MPHELHVDKMASEKSQALYVPTDTCEEKSLKDKGRWYCSKLFLVWILVALLIALLVGLCVEFWYPATERLYVNGKSIAELVAHGESQNQGQLHYKAIEKQVELTTIAREETTPPWHLDFLINPTRLCETWDSPETETYQRNPEVKLLILVPSATGHFTQRSAIRRTWGSVAVQPHGPVRLGFVLGITPNATQQNLIRHESEAFGDIIQADFVDTFRNLTTKSVLMLKWVAAHCSHASYFLKTDDDTFVNLPVLSRVLQKPVFDPSETFVGGYVKKGSVPTRIPSEKHYISEEDFSEEEFPPYADGSSYVTTGPTARQLFDASQRVTPFLPLEDIFITGLCADDIDAKLVHEPSFRNSMPEDLSWDRLSSFATVHNLMPSDIDSMFDQIHQAIKETLNFSQGSSFVSSDIFGSLPFFENFAWSEEDTDSDESFSADTSESPKPKTIFDIFDIVRKQLGIQGGGGMSKENKAAGPDFNYEELPVSAQRINKGNLLNVKEEKQILEALNRQKGNNSTDTIVLYFK